MKIGSLFNGSGGFPLAASMCGITPVWASEIEPFPIRVTTKRFPKMTHLGDIQTINGAKIEPVDVITFGSPCQDLSVAGKRAGLKHKENGDEETTRSGLFMEAVRVIKEMREKTNGTYPTFVIWENVPGAFSSNRGGDYRIVLEELIRIAEPTAVMPEVPAAGWPYADLYCGDGWSLAYRVFDAQYWGVPQRRRRIYLVLDLGEERAGKILFEREGVRGYFTPGAAPRKRTPRHAKGSTGTDDRAKLIASAGFKSGQGAKAGGIGYEMEKSPTLASEAGGNSVPSVVEKVCDAKGFDLRQITNKVNRSTLKRVHPTLTATGSPCIVGTVATYDARGNGDGKTVSTITGDHNGRISDYTSVVCEPVYCLQGNCVDRAGTAKCNGAGVKADISYTLNTIDRPAVAYAMQGFGDYKESDIGSSLKARDYKDAADLVIGVDCRNMNGSRELYPTLQAKPNGGQSLNFSGAVCHKENQPKPRYIVRRLTPLECCRLQGFPDGWTDGLETPDPSEEELQFWRDVFETRRKIVTKATKPKTDKQIKKWLADPYTDGAAYKMWGNGIALPNALYVMQGIVEAESRVPGNEKKTEH